MADFSKISGNLLYTLKHYTRETVRPTNAEIDPQRTAQNYFLSPEDHGRSAAESKAYYEKRLSEVYHVDSARLVTACSWVVTAPADLDPSQEQKFFVAAYEFFSQECGGERAVIQAVVHKDEGVRGLDGEIKEGRAHMHFAFIPELKNKSYISAADKFTAGLKAGIERYDLKLDKEKARALYKVIERYESSPRRTRDRDAIRGFCEVLDLKRDDARWIFTRCRRLDSEKYMRRVNCDGLISRKYLSELHPRFQAFINAKGVHATVHSGVTGGRSREVADLKRETKEQLLQQSREKIKELTAERDRLKERVNELERQVSPEHVWGDGSSWGREISWDR